MDINYYLKMKYVDRLSLGFKHRQYNLMEHGFMVGMLFKHFASKEDVPYDINVWDKILLHDIVEVESTDLSWEIKNLTPKTKQLWEGIENEVVTKHFQLEKYTDENIKKSLTKRQFALFKACDILDLYIFVKDEIYIGNNTKFMNQVLSNCNKVFDSLDFEFPSILEFKENY